MTDDSARICEDAFDLLCGARLGEGAHRDVYACHIRPDLVVKVEKAPVGCARSFMNVQEYQFWTDHEHCKQVAKWLAGCLWLAPDGRILLQQRCDPLPSTFELPDKLPAFLTDHKRENFGLLDGRFVCLDYGWTVPNPSLQLRKARW